MPSGSSGKGKFRASVWDPHMIIIQMLVMQTTYYLQLVLYLVIASFFTGRTATMDQVFNYREINFSSNEGAVVVIGQSLMCVVLAAALYFVVGRARKCLDFACTVYFFHLLFSAFHAGFPMSWEWWVVISASAGITTVAGEQVCMIREMEEIPVVGGKNKGGRRGKGSSLEMV